MVPSVPNVQVLLIRHETLRRMLV